MVAKAVAHVLHGVENSSLRDKNQRGVTEVNEWCTGNSLPLDKRENKCSVILNYKKSDYLPVLQMEWSFVTLQFI